MQKSVFLSGLSFTTVDRDSQKVCATSHWILLLTKPLLKVIRFKVEWFSRKTWLTAVMSKKCVSICSVSQNQQTWQHQESKDHKVNCSLQSKHSDTNWPGITWITVCGKCETVHHVKLQSYKVVVISIFVHLKTPLNVMDMNEWGWLVFWLSSFPSNTLMFLLYQD